MNDRPYQLRPPALVSFSGGRTSGYMLWQILQAWGGVVPAGCYVTFANTGKERPETLDFVHEIEQRWSVPIRWLEYRYVPAADGGADVDVDDETDAKPLGKHHYVEVAFDTASRGGEPFSQLIAARKYLPNPVTRFCTIELKIRTMKKFMVDQGHEEWDVAIGLRADEPTRVHRAKLSCAKERFNNIMPMATAGATLADVMKFWGEQPFDLQLEQHEGNCDLCFLKGSPKIERILRDRPDLAQWWIDREAETGQPFRCDRPKYAHLLNIVQEQGTFPFSSHEYDVCACTD